MSEKQHPYRVLQEWEGWIDGVKGETVYTSLVDVTAGDAVANDTAEIPAKEFLRPGQIFRWRVLADANDQTWTDIKFAPFDALNLSEPNQVVTDAGFEVQNDV